MARIRRHGTAAILYLILSIAGLGLMGCGDSTDAPIAQPDTINPNLEGAFNGTGNLSLNGNLTAATFSIDLTFPEEEAGRESQADDVHNGKVRRVSYPASPGSDVGVS